MRAPVIAASILSADFARLGEECERVLAAGADWIHFDVMDQHYVPNLTVGPMVCAALRRHGIRAPIDVHLMVEPVDALALAFVEAGANLVSFHPEASRHPHRTVEAIRRAGAAVGLALNPATPIHWLDHLLEELDLVLLMSVDPGFGGQAFLPSALSKIRAVRARLEAAGRPVRLEVDGGIKVDNIAAVAAAGADTFVAGSAIFGSPDYAATIAALRAAAAAAGAGA